MPVSRESALRRVATAVALAGAAAAVFVAPAPAAAAPECTAHGTLPAKVSLHGDHVVIHSVLHGSAGCRGQRTDNGASATLHRPHDTNEDLRWRKFGKAQQIDLYINLDHAGKYVLDAGDVQVYGWDYRQVNYRWRTTTMIVKHAGRFQHTRAAGGVVSGRAQHYGKFGWAGTRGATVHLQRRVVGTSTWHTVGSEHAGSGGSVRFSTPTNVHHQYRLAFAKTTTVWGAHSHPVTG